MTYPQIPLKRLLARNDGGVWGEEPDGINDTIVLRSTEQSADGQWLIDDPAPRKLAPSDAERFRLHNDDLLVTKSSGSSNHIGKATLVTQEVASLRPCYSNFMQRLRISSRNSAKFYWYVLRTKETREQMGFYSTTSTGLANLNATILGGLLVPKLPLQTQLETVRFLDRETAQIDDLIIKQERLIGLLAEKRQAIITHAITKGLDPSATTVPSGIPWLGEVNDSWPLRPLKAAGHINLGKMIQPDPKLETDFEAPYLRAANVQPNGTLALGDVKNMWFKDSELQMLDVLSGDVVVVEGGIGGFGRAAYINQDLPGFGYQNSINRIRPSKSVDGRFLTYLLLAARHAGYIHAYCTGVSMPHLTAEKLAAIRVPLPDRATQTNISDHIDARLAKLNALSDNASAVITILHERRSALISAAVTGKIATETQRISA